MYLPMRQLYTLAHNHFSGMTGETKSPVEYGAPNYGSSRLPVKLEAQP
jgi:hypothetical protein